MTGTCIIPDPDDPTKHARVNIFAGLDADSRRLLKIHIKLGWQKHDKYYSNITSLAYAAAVIFDPTTKIGDGRAGSLFERGPCRK
ncbi:hypothetical protein F4782DRAFT_343558 [Xylaria castorea]|nr:hypothetical protein F4782DRAFT_343558 [Xylaria castorea]